MTHPSSTPGRTDAVMCVGIAVQLHPPLGMSSHTQRWAVMKRKVCMHLCDGWEGRGMDETEKASTDGSGNDKEDMVGMLECYTRCRSAGWLGDG